MRRVLSFLKKEGKDMNLEREVLLENGTKSVSKEEVTFAISDGQTSVRGFYVHSKASEKYVVVSFGVGNHPKEWVIPYQYRRTNLFIDDLPSLVKLIKDSKPMLNSDGVASFKRMISGKETEYFGAGATVTIPIFQLLLMNCGEWVWNKNFHNENPQRRVQDIKETGFTIATKFEGRTTYHMLLPFPQVKSFSYETIPSAIRKKIFAAHNGINAYTAEPASTSCLPDHKFPEIRWDKDTPVSNEDLSHQEMIDKFQIVPESINQAKREVCRKCFQSGIRGKLNGINFFYKGTGQWDASIPRIGKQAEDGCVGCFWYDMLAWRKALHERIGVAR